MIYYILKNGAEHWCNLIDVTSLSTLMHVYGYSENSMSHMITLSIYYIIHDEQFVILKVKHVNKKKDIVCLYFSFTFYIIFFGSNSDDRGKYFCLILNRTYQIYKCNLAINAYDFILIK